MLQIKDIKQRMRKTAETYGLVKVTLFGSFARGDADEASNVDLLVETSRPLGFARGVIYNEFETELARPVDVVFGAHNLYPFVRDAVKTEEVVLCEAR